ncbi:MAG: glycosyl hydrolase family 8 [Acidobacteriaceae bacterium]
MKLPVLILALCTIATAAAQTPSPNIPRFAGDGSGAFATHRYRDLFAEAGHSPADTQAKIDRAYQRLFHGDPLTERVYFEAGSNTNGPLAFITDWANNDARTEGMSYGMMIAVQLGHKREFDALWNWSNTYMLITDPKNPNVGYFSWSMNTDGTPRSTGPAPDGEEYYAMALLFAARRWGNGHGIYDYQAQADRILHLMRHHAEDTATGPFRIHPNDEPFVFDPAKLTSPNLTEQKQASIDTDIALKAEGKTPPPAPHWPMHANRPETSGPMMNAATAEVQFVPGPYGNFTDASYHLPAFYELFARWGPTEDRAFWLKAADVSRELFARVTNPTTGLAPDRSHFDFSPMIETYGPDRGKPVPFSYDSWRTASNWSVDYSWWHKDPRETVLSNHIQAFLIGQGISTFVDRYTLDGKPLSVRHSTGMLATTTVAGLAATPGANEKAFVDELWNTPIPNGEQRYFDGMLYLMSMLHASGHFRISDWDANLPAAKP